MTEKRKLFESIVPQYSEKLYWAIRRIVLCHDDANDVLQNVFIKVWNGIDDFQNRSKLSTWLYRIAVNEALDFLRRKRNVASLDISDNISVADRLEADQYFDGDRAQALLQEAIASLPDVQRVVFNLRYYDEMKYSEISQLLDTSEGALNAVVQLCQPLIVCHRLRGVGAVLVEQPAVLAGQHLVALARAEQRVVQPGVHQHKLIAERRVIDQKVVKIARQLPQRALQHLRQAGHQPVLMAVHRQLLGKDVEDRERQSDHGAEHADKANFDRFTHGSAPPLKLKINKRAVGACRDAHKSQKQ